VKRFSCLSSRLHEDVCTQITGLVNKCRLHTDFFFIVPYERLATSLVFEYESNKKYKG
jgi:hypothetical protein